MTFDNSRDLIELPADTLGDLLAEARSAVSTLYSVSTITCIRPEVYTATRQLAHRLDAAVRSADDERRVALDGGRQS